MATTTADPKQPKSPHAEAVTKAIATPKALAGKKTRADQANQPLGSEDVKFDPKAPATSGAVVDAVEVQEEPQIKPATRSEVANLVGTEITKDGEPVAKTAHGLGHDETDTPTIDAMVNGRKADRFP